MEIACPQCGTKYRIPDSSLGPVGREVRCKQCAHTWHQFPEGFLPPPQPEPPPFEVSFSPQPIAHPTDHLAEREGHTPPSAKPVRTKTKTKSLTSGYLPMKILFGTLCISMVTLGLIAYYPNLISHSGFFAPIYGIFGLHDTSKLGLTEVVLKKGAQYTIDCKIKNDGGRPRVIPPMKVTLRDSNQQEIARNILRFAAGKTVKPGESIPCQTITLDIARFKTPPASAILDIGNSLELSLRN